MNFKKILHVWSHIAYTYLQMCDKIINIHAWLDSDGELFFINTSSAT